MENLGSSDTRLTIISVLSEGRDLANQLKTKLHLTSDPCDALVENILSSYENAIKLLDNGVGLPSNTSHVTNALESPNSNDVSPVASEGSDISPKDQTHKSKKRKTLPKWSEQVRVRSETGFEGQHEDGYNWRKYGQKDILGANHPRAYYRCTHRNTQGCLATKQVQRADEDPLVFEVVYRGKHSCVQGRLKENKENDLFLMKKGSEEESSMGLKVENQELVTEDKGHFPSFTYLSTPMESENLEATIFPEMAYEDFGNDLVEIVSNASPFGDFPCGDLDFPIDQIDFSGRHL